MNASTIVRRTGVAGVALLLLATRAGTVVHGQPPTDAELRRLNEAYAQAWAKGNAKAVAALHTTESVRVAADGTVAVGRVEIEQALMAALNGPYRTTKIGLNAGQTTRAGQDVYVSEGTFQIAGGMTPAGVPTRGRYLHTLVRLSGRWLIAGDASIAAARPPK
jgi:uncharacterized protein (TIGR02246 family)